MKRIITSIILMGCLVAGGMSCAKQEIVVVTGEHYEMSFHMPVRWERRLDSWDEWIKPLAENERFVWIYIVKRSVSDDPIELKWDDYKLSYGLGETERYTTTLAATGNNDVYMRVIDRDYGGVTDEDGYGMRYVFVVPKDATDYVLEITSLPPVSLSVR